MATGQSRWKVTLSEVGSTIIGRRHISQITGIIFYMCMIFFLFLFHSLIYNLKSFSKLSDKTRNKDYIVPHRTQRKQDPGQGLHQSWVIPEHKSEIIWRKYQPHFHSSEVMAASACLWNSLASERHRLEHWKLLHEGIHLSSLVENDHILNVIQ